VKAVLDHFAHDTSDAAVYAGSGHAFVINVHEALCPSSPYCWRIDRTYPLIRNLGAQIEDLGFFHAGAGAEERARVEQRLRDHLDAGKPCSLVNMDHQVIEGYDEEGFLTARPWPKNPDYPPGRLEFGTWRELGDEVHVNFFLYERREPAAAEVVRRDALRFAIDAHRRPERLQEERYAAGPGAWDHWAAAAEEHGASHGNWWNGTVWSECRARAADWFAETAPSIEGEAAARAEALSASYRRIAEGLAEMADRELPAPRKIELARDLKAREAAAVGEIEGLLARM